MVRLVAVLGAAAVVLLVTFVAAPSSAQAFVGENLVINPETGKLTAAAEALLKQGKTIPEIIAEAKASGELAGGAAGGVLAENGAASTFEASGVLPTVGTAVAGFAAGWEVGAEACELIGISGCFHLAGLFGSSAPSPGVSAGFPTGGQYSFETTAILVAPGVHDPPMSFVWYSGNGGTGGSVKAYTGHSNAQCAGWTPPADASIFVAAGVVEGYCGVGKNEDVYSPVRVGMDGLGLSYDATDDPSVPNLSYKAPAEWSKQTATQLGSSSDGAKVGQAIGHKLSPETVPNPYATTGTVPNCGGLTYAQCAAKLEFEGLEPVKNTLGWQTADLGTAADRVVQTEPVAGHVSNVGAKVTVVTNPVEAAMPVLVPQWEDHETYAHYAARLAPALTPHRETVGEANEDAEAGPEAVLGTQPQPGSRADPGAETDVNVRTNPTDAPPVGSGVGTCNATIGAIDWSPLNQPLGDKFPFGIFAFFVGWLNEWEAGEGIPPSWTVTIVPEGTFGSNGIDIHIDLAFLGPMVSIVRVVFLFAAFVGLLWFLGTAAAKLQGDTS